MTKEDIEHLEWIFGRMIEVHGEHENFDYMNRFRNIIQSEKNKVKTPKLHNEGDIVSVHDYTGTGVMMVEITDILWDDLNGNWKYYFDVEGEDLYVYAEEIIKN